MKEKNTKRTMASIDTDYNEILHRSELISARAIHRLNVIDNEIITLEEERTGLEKIVCKTRDVISAMKNT